jgi:hypothetical protein
MMISDGLHPELSEAEYRALDLPSGSEFATLDRSPAAWLHRHTHPVEATPAMRFGTLVHSLVLMGHAPERWTVTPTYDEVSRYASPEWVHHPGFSLATKEGRAWKGALPAGAVVLKSEDWRMACERAWADAHPGCQIFDDATWARAQAAAESLRSHPVLARWISMGMTEVSMVWTDPASGVQLKGRADLCVVDDDLGPLVVDLKLLSTGCERMAVQRAVFGGGYWLQVPAYAWGFELCGGPASRAVIVACDSGDVPGVGVYPMSATWQAQGLDRVRALLGILAQCQRTGDYWADDRAIMPIGDEIEAPRWADVF